MTNPSHEILDQVFGRKENFVFMPADSAELIPCT